MERKGEAHAAFSPLRHHGQPFCGLTGSPHRAGPQFLPQHARNHGICMKGVGSGSDLHGLGFDMGRAQTQPPGLV